MTGASNDYSVGTTWLEHDGRYYLIEVLRERLIFPDLKRRVVAEADRHARSDHLDDRADARSGLAHLVEI